MLTETKCENVTLCVIIGFLLRLKFTLGSFHYLSDIFEVYHSFEFYVLGEKKAYHPSIDIFYPKTE